LSSALAILTEGISIRNFWQQISSHYGFLKAHIFGNICNSCSFCYWDWLNHNGSPDSAATGRM